MNDLIIYFPHRRCAYFGVVVGHARSYDPESYAGGSLATGRVSHARNVKGDGPDKKGYPGPPGWRSVTGMNSQVRQSYLREYRPCRSELQVFLAREVALGKGPIPRVTGGLDRSPKPW
jgi:hypothetical protein